MSQSMQVALLGQLGTQAPIFSINLQNTAKENSENAGFYKWFVVVFIHQFYPKSTSRTKRYKPQPETKAVSVLGLPVFLGK